jgi:hypothetical protein
MFYTIITRQKHVISVWMPIPGDGLDKKIKRKIWEKFLMTGIFPIKFQPCYQGKVVDIEFSECIQSFHRPCSGGGG